MYEYSIYNYADCPKEVFHFRYKIYVEELNRKQSYVCHDTKTVEDPMDPAAYHGVARKDGEIAAVIRLNLVRDGGVTPYYDFYELYNLSREAQETASICTRNMVAARYRNSPLAYRMLKLMYVLALENGAISCFIDVNAPLISMFEKLGCRAQFEKEHPDYGRVTVMRLNGLDLDYLTKIRSPFAATCRKFLEARAELMPA